MTVVAREEGRGARWPRDDARGARWPGDQTRCELFYKPEHAKPARPFFAWVSTVLRGFGSAESIPVKKEPDCATLNAQSTHHEAQSGPKLVPWSWAPCAPRSRERKKRPAAGRAKLNNVQKKPSHTYTYPFGSIPICSMTFHPIPFLVELS